LNVVFLRSLTARVSGICPTRKGAECVQLTLTGRVVLAND
jgi:hypothetical protein